MIFTIAFCLAVAVGFVFAGLADLFVMNLKRVRQCAWCRKILRGGFLPATHGICSKCEVKWLE